MTTARHWSAALKRLDACSDAVEWAATQPSLQVAWGNCERSGWMLWLCARLDVHRDECRVLAYAFAERAISHAAPAALRAAAGAPDISADHAAELRRHADTLGALRVHDELSAAAARDAAWAASVAAGAAAWPARDAAGAAAWAARGAAWAASDAEQAQAIRTLIPTAPALVGLALPKEVSR